MLPFFILLSFVFYLTDISVKCYILHTFKLSDEYVKPLSTNPQDMEIGQSALT